MAHNVTFLHGRERDVAFDRQVFLSQFDDRGFDSVEKYVSSLMDMHFDLMSLVDNASYVSINPSLYETSLTSLRSKSKRMGFVTMCNVLTDALKCVEAGDFTAMYAVLGRLSRVSMVSIELADLQFRKFMVDMV